MILTGLRRSPIRVGILLLILKSVWPMTASANVGLPSQCVKEFKSLKLEPLYIACLDRWFEWGVHASDQRQLLSQIESCKKTTASSKPKASAYSSCLIKRIPIDFQSESKIFEKISTGELLASTTVFAQLIQKSCSKAATKSCKKALVAVLADILHVTDLDSLEKRKRIPPACVGFSSGRKALENCLNVFYGI